MSLPPRLRAGDALNFTLQTNLPAGTLVFYVLNGVINRAPTQQNIGGTGIALDATGSAAIAVASSVTAGWAPGRYDWYLFSVDASSNREQIATGRIRIEANVAIAPIDNRSRNQRMLDAIESVLEGAALDDVSMYKIGGREVTKVPRLELEKQRGIYVARVNAELRRKGGVIASDTIGIRFGGR